MSGKGNNLADTYIQPVQIHSFEHSFEHVQGEPNERVIRQTTARSCCVLYKELQHEFIADWKAAENVSGEQRGLEQCHGKLGEVTTKNNDSSVAFGSLECR